MQNNRESLKRMISKNEIKNKELNKVIKILANHLAVLEKELNSSEKQIKEELAAENYSQREESDRISQPSTALSISSRQEQSDNPDETQNQISQS